MLIAFRPVVVLCIEVAIYLGTLFWPCGDCRTGGTVIQVTATKERQSLFAADFAD